MPGHACFSMPDAAAPSCPAVLRHKLPGFILPPSPSGLRAACHKLGFHDFFFTPAWPWRLQWWEPAWH